MTELLMIPWSVERWRAFLSEQFALQHTHFVKVHRQGDFRLAMLADEPAGRSYFDRSSREWVLIDILLAAKMRGKGLGSAMIGWLQRAAAGAGSGGVRRSVAHDNPRARTLYLRLGFADIGDIAGTHWAWSHVLEPGLMTAACAKFSLPSARRTRAKRQAQGSGKR